MTGIPTIMSPKSSHLFGLTPVITRQVSKPAKTAGALPIIGTAIGCCRLSLVAFDALKTTNPTTGRKDNWSKNAKTGAWELMSLGWVPIAKDALASRLKLPFPPLG